MMRCFVPPSSTTGSTDLNRPICHNAVSYSDIGSPDNCYNCNSRYPYVPPPHPPYQRIYYGEHWQFQPEQNYEQEQHYDMLPTSSSTTCYDINLMYPHNATNDFNVVQHLHSVPGSFCRPSQLSGGCHGHSYLGNDVIMEPHVSR